MSQDHFYSLREGGGGGGITGRVVRVSFLSLKKQFVITAM